MVSQRILFVVIGIVFVALVSLAVVVTIKVQEIERLDKSYTLRLGTLERERQQQQTRIEELLSELETAKTQAQAYRTTLESTRQELIETQAKLEAAEAALNGGAVRPAETPTRTEASASSPTDDAP